MPKNKWKISSYCLFVDATLLTIYVFPSSLLEQMGVAIDKYFFMVVMLGVYGCIIIRNRKVGMFEFSAIIMTIMFSVLKKDVGQLHLLTIAISYRLLQAPQEINIIKEHLKKSAIVDICTAATAIYTLIYFGHDGRYMSTGNTDPNTTGLAVFCLFVIIRSRHKKVGDLLLLLGLLTLSRTYFLALIIYYGYEHFNGRNLVNVNFAVLSIFGVLVLIGIANAFIFAEQNNMLMEYQSGLRRFSGVLDYSNYFRFTTNLNVIGIYIQNPQLMLMGMTDSQFMKLNAKYTLRNGLRYRAIKPHNYFFSYLQIYGIWSLPIFGMTYKVLNRVISKENTGVAVVIFLYLMILSLGAANYWLVLSLITLIMSSTANSCQETARGKI